MGNNHTATMRIILIRHGQPDIEPARWISHRAFQHYIDRYQDAGLAPESMPPEHLRETVAGVSRVFTSELKRAIESAERLLPGVEQVSSAVFTEAPLASPPIRGLRLKVPAWAVLARVAWHGGYTPSIENYWQAKRRALRAFRILSQAAVNEGTAVLVAHGYFNAILGRMLTRRGWRRVSGAHRAVYWNTVVYELAGLSQGATIASRSGRGRSSIGAEGLPT
ncbi:MAG: histidine phosphatase family protein [Alphaproteobacteria bacterium]|nr:histidine phosphatase family protein [Alphaproteobacteria bacterium]